MEVKQNIQKAVEDGKLEVYFALQTIFRNGGICGIKKLFDIMLE